VMQVHKSTEVKMFVLRLLSESGEGPDTTLLWLLIIALVFFFLMVIIGWLVSRNKKPEAEVQHEAYGHGSPAADDLTKIEGIGPKVAKVLNEAGITTFEGLAHANIADVQQKLKDAGLQMMNPEGWIDQAKLAAKGDWTALEKLQSELKGGRRISG
jgi:hypothetical protein